MSTAINDQNTTFARDSILAKIISDLMMLDRDVFAVAILDYSGALKAFSSKPFFSKENRKESGTWKKIALRNAALVKLANQDEHEANPATGIVLFRNEYKQILINIHSKKIIIEAIMPLWNHSAVFFEAVHKYFSSRKSEISR